MLMSHFHTHRTGTLNTHTDQYNHVEARPIGSHRSHVFQTLTVKRPELKPGGFTGGAEARQAPGGATRFHRARGRPHEVSGHQVFPEVYVFLS